jgi:hypothetical protein
VEGGRVVGFERQSLQRFGRHVRRGQLGMIGNRGRADLQLEHRGLNVRGGASNRANPSTCDNLKWQYRRQVDLFWEPFVEDQVPQALRGLHLVVHVPACSRQLLLRSSSFGHARRPDCSRLDSGRG